MVHFGIVLGVICAAAALGVAGTYRLTQARIRERLEAKQNEALSLIFRSVGGRPAGVVAGQGDERVFKAVADAGSAAADKVIAYAAMGSAQGYSSRVRVLAAVDADCSKVLAIFVTYQAETPGLGTQVSDVKPDATWGQVLTGSKNPVKATAGRYEAPASLDALPAFQKQFAGVPAGSVRLGEGVDGITGATISSRAVADAVNDAVQRIRSAVQAGPPR